jgi:hypothetical protein
VTMNRDHALVWRRRSPARLFFRQLAETMRAIIDEQLVGEVTPL